MSLSWNSRMAQQPSFYTRQPIHLRRTLAFLKGKILSTSNALAPLITSFTCCCLFLRTQYTHNIASPEQLQLPLTFVEREKEGEPYWKLYNAFFPQNPQDVVVVEECSVCVPLMPVA